MSDNIEIIMDIDSLEIFDVIDLDKNEDVIDSIPEEKVSPYYDLNRVWLGNYYYKLASIFWKVIKDDVIHELYLRIKLGAYPYFRRARDGTWFPGGISTK